MSEPIKTENLTPEEKLKAENDAIQKRKNEAEVDSKDKRQEYDVQEVDTKVTPSRK
jgi:hypothetical protein